MDKKRMNGLKGKMNGLEGWMDEKRMNGLERWIDKYNVFEINITKNKHSPSGIMIMNKLAMPGRT